MREYVRPAFASLAVIVALAACLICASGKRGFCAEPNRAEDPALDASFKALAQLELGQDLGMLHPIRQAVVRSHSTEPVRKELERRLIAVLEGEATDLAKDYACRQLAIVGSDASVSALARLLPHPRLSYMSRYAMEGIGSPVMATSLREAVGQTTGRQKIGVVISLGRLADLDAVPVISVLLNQDDLQLSEVAVIALGRIGTVRAVKELHEFVADAPDQLKISVTNALLQAAGKLSTNGEQEVVVQVCDLLNSSTSVRVRAGAFRLLLRATERSESLTMMIDGLAADELWRRAVAADCVRELRDTEEIKTVALAVQDLPIPGKIAALDSLKERSDSAVRAAALKALRQSDPDAQVAALEALIASGTPEDVAMLIDLVSNARESRVQVAASKTLCLMTAPGTSEVMILAMNSSGDLHPAVVRCAFDRRSPSFVPAFLKAAESSSEATRLEALKALETMATGKDVNALVELLCKTLPGEQREAAGRAVWKSCQKIPDPTKRSEPLVAAMENAEATQKCILLPWLARLGGEQSLAAVRLAMQSTDQTVRDAGYRALANWPDATVADELFGIARTSGVESYRVWALRAYARVVALPSERSPQRTFEMLRDALDLAVRIEDRELIVSRLGSVRVPDALTLLLACVDDPELKDAAVPAVFVLAKGLSQTCPDQAAVALKKVKPLTKDPAVIQQIPKVLRDIEARVKNEKK